MGYDPLLGRVFYHKHSMKDIKALMEEFQKYLLIDGSRAMTGNLDFGGKNIKNVGRLASDLIPDVHDTWSLGAGGSGLWLHCVSTMLLECPTSMWIQNLQFYYGYYGLLYTKSHSEYPVYFDSYDTAYRVCATLVNGRLDINRAGDITILDDKFIRIGKDSDGSLPTPSVNYRGKMIRTEGTGTSGEDELFICMFDGSSYVWKKITLS